MWFVINPRPWPDLPRWNWRPIMGAGDVQRSQESQDWCGECFQGSTTPVWAVSMCQVSSVSDLPLTCIVSNLPLTCVVSNLPLTCVVSNLPLTCVVSNLPLICVVSNCHSPVLWVACHSSMLWVVCHLPLTYEQSAIHQWAAVCIRALRSLQVSTVFTCVISACVISHVIVLVSTYKCNYWLGSQPGFLHTSRHTSGRS